MRGNSTARPVLFAVAGCLAVVLVGTLAFLGIRSYYQERAAELNDFKADVAAVGITAQPRWEDESTTKKGKTTTESVLEADVVVAGCPVEIARDDDERGVAGNAGGRTIEVYEVDEVNFNGREYDIENGPTGMPNIAAIETYLRQNESRFKVCLTPKPTR